MKMTYGPPHHAPPGKEEAAHGPSVGAYHSLKHSGTETADMGPKRKGRCENMVKEADRIRLEDGVKQRSCGCSLDCSPCCSPFS